MDKIPCSGLIRVHKFIYIYKIIVYICIVDNLNPQSGGEGFKFSHLQHR